MRNRQERRQVKLKMTKVSNTEPTAERGIGSKSPESSSSYFLVIKDLFQTRRCSQASNTPLRDICRQVGRSWPGKGALRRMKLIYLHKRLGGQGNLDMECYLPSKTFQSNQCTAPLSAALLNNGSLAPECFHQEVGEDVGGARRTAFRFDHFRACLAEAQLSLDNERYAGSTDFTDHRITLRGVLSIS